MSRGLEVMREIVLRHYPAALAGLRWVALGGAGGFSGAHIWRGESHGEPLYALKAWPWPMDHERLAGIHRLMARAAHLPFVPEVVAPLNPTVERTASVIAAGRVWDVTRWMPGTADFATNPTPARLANACAALAELHRAWRPPLPAFAPCPGVQRRRQLLAEWDALRTALRSLAGSPRRGRDALEVAAPRAAQELRPWESRPVPVQPCLCDVWGAHVLFTGDEVTGIIDYGAIKEDHVAVDLARLLGDLVGDDATRFAEGLAAYRAAGGALDTPDEFVHLLDRTGTACGIVFWLRKLGADTPDPAIIARIDRLAARIDRLYPP
jgi:homoserine kinase type II